MCIRDSISLPDEVQQELESLRLQGKDDEADAKRADALAAIEPKAQEILDSLAADGSNFDAVMAEKSEDCLLYTSYSMRLISPDNSVQQKS